MISFLFFIQSCVFASLGHADIQYLKGQNCEYTKNKKTRIVSSSLISISDNPDTKEINFFNAINEDGALLVGLSSHQYLSKFELEFPMREGRYKPFSLPYEEGIKYFGNTGTYVNRAMAIVFDQEDIKKLEFILWDDSHQTDENGGVTLLGAYSYKCESISRAEPEFVQSVAFHSFQVSLYSKAARGYVHMKLPFSYTDHVKNLDFEDVFSIIYKVNGGWKNKTITKSYNYSGLSSWNVIVPRFEIELSQDKESMHFDKMLTFFDRAPEFVPKDSIETRFIFERRYKTTLRPTLKIEKIL